MHSKAHRIIVGYDGSRGAQRALGFALSERQSHSELVLICAYEPAAQHGAAATLAAVVVPHPL